MVASGDVRAVVVKGSPYCCSSAAWDSRTTSARCGSGAGNAGMGGCPPVRLRRVARLQC